MGFGIITLIRIRQKTLYEKILKISPKIGPNIKLQKQSFRKLKSKESKLNKHVNLKRSDYERILNGFVEFKSLTGNTLEYSKTDYTVKGLKFYDDKNIPEAVIHLQGAVKIDPQNPEVHYHYAMIQVESAFNGNENGFSIAKRELELCLNLEPDPTLRGKALELLSTLAGDNQSASTADKL